MICLISGVDIGGITASSGAMADEAEDPEVRTVLDNSDKRVSGLIYISNSILGGGVGGDILA
jgi:hypothetical protein